jgi:uncharacterized protein with von Willebrand factor type A (vWA) domain
MRESTVVANLLALPRLLRRAGVHVDAERTRLMLRALAVIDLANEADVRAACRAVLLTHPADRARFDDAFDLFWALLRGARPGSRAGADERARRARAKPTLSSDDVPTSGHDRSTSRTVRLLASPAEVLRSLDFAAMSADERAVAARFLERLEWSPGLRPSRRFKPAPRGSHLDTRATLRRSLASFGEPTVLLRRAPRPKRRPLVLLLDVSGSMEAYTRLLLHLSHSLARGWSRVEAFTFGTRLTRISRQLRHRRADIALARVGRNVSDWSGGTRIGEALHEFNRRWSRRVLGRGAVVLLVTDGWDRGDPLALAAEAAALQRASYRLIWLNPLAGTRGYAAEASGARALASAVDDHLAANTLDGLLAIARILNEEAGRGRPVRRQVRA